MSKILRFFFLSVMLFGAASFTLSGQSNKLKEFSVESVSDDPFDGSGRSSQYGRVDGDGYNYAILKVTTDDPSDDLYSYRFNFGALYSEIVVHPNEGEIWVYVQRGAKSVTIERSGYRTISRYDLQRTFESGNVYRMALKVKQAPALIQRQLLQFMIEPAMENVVIRYTDSKGNTDIFGITDQSGSAASRLELGTYTYEIMAKNYNSAIGRIILDNPEKAYIENVTLRTNFSQVNLQASVGVEIYIDGEYKGTGAWSGLLKSGEYQVESRKANHKSVQTSIKVSEGGTLHKNLESPIPIVGTLSLISYPSGVKVKIDGKEHGTTPIVISDLLIGSHTLELSKDNYKTSMTTIYIRENFIVEKDIVLEEGVDEITNLGEGQPQSQFSVQEKSGIDMINGHEYVDLGLPSGLKWATCNVGAENPEDYGNYYAWGETSTKGEYSSKTYKETKKKEIKFDITGMPLYDVARKQWGSSWRIPTEKEFEELINKCEWTWTTQNGVWGYKVMGPNGNRIFLPAAGYRRGSSLSYAGECGYYWSSTPNGTNNAHSLLFNSSSHFTYWGDRGRGHGVRPVSE